MDRFLRYVTVVAAIMLVCGCITIDDTEKTTSTRIKIRTLAEIITTTSTTTPTTTFSTSTTLPPCSFGLDPLLCEQTGGLIYCSGGECICQCTTTTKATTTTTRSTTSTSASDSQPSSTTTTTFLASSTTTSTSSTTASSSSTSTVTSSTTVVTIKSRQCADIDQVNIFKKSYIIFENVTYEDYCKDKATVVEMYCILNQADGQPMMATQITVCPSGYGCSDGACRRQQATTTSTLGMRTPPCGQYGDVNGDGFVTAEDAQQLNANTLIPRGDTNGNGVIDLDSMTNDKLYLIMYVNREADTFPVCS